MIDLAPGISCRAGSTRAELGSRLALVETGGPAQFLQLTSSGLYLQRGEAGALVRLTEGGTPVMLIERLLDPGGFASNDTTLAFLGGIDRVGAGLWTLPLGQDAVMPSLLLDGFSPSSTDPQVELDGSCPARPRARAIAQSVHLTCIMATTRQSRLADKGLHAYARAARALRTWRHGDGLVGSGA